jgi:hypothetical protein
MIMTRCSHAQESVRQLQQADLANEADISMTHEGDQKHLKSNDDG